MVNHARITERGIGAKVIHIIPRSGVQGKARVEVLEEEKLGYRCPDYVLEGRLKELHELKKKGIISLEKLDELCSEEFDRTVNVSQNPKYIREMRGLLARHKRYKPLLSVGERLEDAYLLMERYGQILNIKK